MTLTCFSKQHLICSGMFNICSFASNLFEACSIFDNLPETAHKQGVPDVYVRLAQSKGIAH